MAETSQRSSLELFGRLLTQARPYWPHLLGLLALSFVASLLALLTPLPLRLAVDSVIGSRPVPGFLLPALPDAAAGSKA